MTSRLAFGLVVAMLAGMPAVADEKDAKTDKDKLQGTWKFTSMERAGQVTPQGDEAPTITFDGDKFTVKGGDAVLQAGTQTLDSSKKPKTVDAKVTEGEQKGTTMLGIYELDGDTLKACFDMSGKKRPTEFKTEAGTDLMLVVMKRVKK